MPTLGSHFSDETAAVVEAAAKASSAKKVGPYIAEAVMQRLEREGMMPGNPTAEILAVANEVGHEDSLIALRNLQRRKARAATERRAA